ncbi:MAG TPA: hypothetical protein VGS97_02790 [Actinocrinis sp.]|uniref:hypothetical protein n=1 Tax=Actinocrinis sp. TaxID=1920516 RepID=UPI002DDD1256|nr:hypothetical protein [Actinocrinis sp.]HEV2342998.1 hypothetical protein [Actinocrinis sp.]
MILLTHETAAELLFAAGLIPASVTEAGRAVAAEYRRRHGDLAAVAADMAQDFGDHPQTALARMRRCLAIAPLRVELPDSYGPTWLRAAAYGSELADRTCDALLGESAGFDEHDPEVADRG